MLIYLETRDRTTNIIMQVGRTLRIRIIMFVVLFRVSTFRKNALLKIADISTKTTRTPDQIISHQVHKSLGSYRISLDWTGVDCLELGCIGFCLLNFFLSL